MNTQAFIPALELFDWLRGAVRRRENVALRIVTPQLETITLRLSEGKLVLVKCEGRGPLDALVLLAECERLSFSYASVRAVERRELMSTDMFLKWLDTASDTIPNVADSDTDDLSGVLGSGPRPGAPDSGRWSGALRGGQARKGSTAVVVAAVVVVMVIALVGLYATGGDRADEVVETPSRVTAGEPSTRIGRSDTEIIRSSIGEPTTWRAGRAIRLEGLVFVENRVRLVIEPGVTVLGGPGAALIVTRGASIQARGTPAEPIVFTSAQPVGERTGGDWGGVVLLGDAPINRGETSIEGITQDDTRSVFGGIDRSSNCGVLEYVRIEFAGYSIGTDNELNGLTLGGCGSATFIRHVQVHRAHDDGVEIFGGTVDLKYVLVTHARDDAFDWDMGWTGRAQFLIVQQHPDMGDAGFEGDNWIDKPEAKPVSQPRIYNVTMVGSGNVQRAQRAMVVRHGSGGEFRNFLISGFPLESIDLRGMLTADRIASRTLSFGSIVMWAIGPDGRTYFADESGADDDDGGFDELRYFSEQVPDMHLNVPEALGPDAWNLTDPDFTPVAAYVGAGSEWSPPSNEGFWDPIGSFYGAVQYGKQVDWTRGWTAYPES